MFEGLKDKLMGHEVAATQVGNTKVYAWEKDGHLTLNLRGVVVNYVERPGHMDATMSFDIGSADALIAAIRAMADAAKAGK